MTDEKTRLTTVDASQVLFESSSPSKRWFCLSRYKHWLIGGIFFVVSLSIGLLLWKKVQPVGPPSQEAFIDAAINSVPAMFQTLGEFENFAGQHQNSRSVVNGYNASAQYVIESLHTAGFDVFLQHLTVPVGLDLSPPQLSQAYPGGKTLSFILNTDFGGIRYGGLCEDVCQVSGEVSFVPDGGCSPANFANATGQIALIETGLGCEYFDKAMLAEAAGAIAVLFMSPSGNFLLIS
jgi:hypothetical protein